MSTVVPLAELTQFIHLRNTTAPEMQAVGPLTIIRSGSTERSFQVSKTWCLLLSTSILLVSTAVY